LLLWLKLAKISFLLLAFQFFFWGGGGTGVWIQGLARSWQGL
jgi:hypothetical protein